MDIMNRVRTTPRDQLSFAMVEHENRSFPRDPRDFTIDEKIGDEIAENHHAATSDSFDEFRQGVHYARPARIALTASSRFSAIKAGWSGDSVRCFSNSAAPSPVRTSIGRTPAACAV